MYQSILIATDGSELATKALDHGLALAQKLGSSVTVVTVTPPVRAGTGMEGAVYFPYEEMQEAQNAAANTILDRARAAAAAQSVPCQVRHISDMPAAEGIIAAAESVHADLLVMASHGRRGLRRLLLGSQATEVLAHSAVPVLIVR